MFNLPCWVFGGGASEVITVFMVGKIRRMHFRGGMSVREVARRTGLSRNTVRTWLRAPQGKEPRYRRTAGPGKLTPFHAALIEALQTDALRRKKERRTGLALYPEIQAAGYAGGYSRVTDFIRAWRPEGGHQPKAFVPLTFALGEAFQFDWSEEGLVGGGIHYKVQVAHLKLCASRAFWLVAYPSQGHEMLFDARAELCRVGWDSTARHPGFCSREQNPGTPASSSRPTSTSANGPRCSVMPS